MSNKGNSRTIRRRAWLATALSSATTAVTVAVLAMPGAAGAGQAGAAKAAPRWVNFPAAAWQRYVDAPKSIEVHPVRVIASTGDVTDPSALLHGGVTTLNLPKQPAPKLWPTGTTATASSYHAANGGDNGTPTTYVPQNAIDGNPQTFWNDANPDTYPAWLEITSPTAVTLPGITLLSNSDGVPQDFTVEALEGSTMHTVATVTDNSQVQVPIRFSAPVTTTQIEIVVSKDQSSPEGDFTRINEIYPELVPVQPVPSITLDFGKDVVGNPQFDFKGAQGIAPGVRVAFSETRRYLTDVSDFSRSDDTGGYGTDQHVPSTVGPSKWTDTYGCQFGTHVCDDGIHGFRYMKIYVGAVPSDAPYAEPYGRVELDGAALKFTGYLGTPRTYKGWFDSSDAQLNRYWYGASYTNELTTATFENGSVDPRGANSPSLDGKLVLMDGAKRDRDPYSGDLAVSGLTEYLTHNEGQAVTNVLADLANHQSTDGYIPPASINNYGLQLFEYPLYWVLDSWDYALYHGETGYADSYYPSMVELLNKWYPSVTDANGLLDKGMNGTSGYGDYAFLPRSGEVTYYNDLYVLALHDAAKLAAGLHHNAQADAWNRRASQVAAAINAHLWDPSVGAYLDSNIGAVSHPQDANAWAVVAGVATGARATDALAYLSATTQTPYGNAFWDNDSVVSDGTTRVYAFTSYPEIVARFQVGEADSALNEIDRLYGCMSDNDPGITDWEGISAGCQPYEGAYTSMAHGWSTGVVPELTNELLGVQPTAAGFSQWLVQPHPGDIRWTQGQVPTPHGAITVRWQRSAADSRFEMSVRIPDSTQGAIKIPTFGQRDSVWINGRLAWNGETGHAASWTGGMTLTNGYMEISTRAAHLHGTVRVISRAD